MRQELRYNSTSLVVLAVSLAESLGNTMTSVQMAVSLKVCPNGSHRTPFAKILASSIHGAVIASTSPLHVCRSSVTS